MKSVRLAQIFCPAKEANRTHSRGYVEDLSTQAGRKQMHQDGSTEFISASLAFVRARRERLVAQVTACSFA